MSDNTIASKKGILNSQLSNTLMSNPFINRLTKTNVYSYYLVYIILATYFIIEATKIHTVPYLLSGMTFGYILWSLIEYLMHRFLFHWKPRSHIENILVFVLHDVHHSYPKDVSRSITPLIISLPLALFFYYLFKLVAGDYALSIYPGFILGYLVYTIIHDSTHHFPMNFRFAKQLKRNHMRHHYFDHHKNFGVSSPFWDYVFRTYSKETFTP